MNKYKRIGIIKPGHLGDIIVSIPIAQYYHKKGFKVYWPIMKNYYNELNKYFPCINFIPISNDNKYSIYESYTEFKKLNLHYISDISWSWPYSKNNHINATFDTVPYLISKLSISKYKLEINRNIEKENKLYNELIAEKDYTILHLDGSTFSISLENFLEQYKSLIIGKPIIITQKENYNIFDWLKIIENANRIIMLDSVFLNIVEDLSFSEKFNFTKDRYYILRRQLSVNTLRPMQRLCTHWKFLYPHKGNLKHKNI